MDYLTAILLLLAMAVLLLMQRTVTARLARQDAEMTRLRNDVAAVIAGAAGIGEHLGRIESQLRDCRERQNHLETSTRVEQSYGQAIRLVQEGADTDQLMESCGLVRDEAELIRTFYQRRRTG